MCLRMASPAICRQRRPARLILIDRAELLLQERPVDRPRKLHQRMVHVDDRVQPRTQQVGLSALASFLWLHRSLRADQRNHDLRFDGILKSKLQAFGPSNPESLQSQNPSRQKKRLPLNGLGVLHGRLVTRLMRFGYFVNIDPEYEIECGGRRHQSKCSSNRRRGDEQRPYCRNCQRTTSAVGARC